jgi:hypothetical protein
MPVSRKRSAEAKRIAKLVDGETALHEAKPGRVARAWLAQHGPEVRAVDGILPEAKRVERVEQLGEAQDIRMQREQLGEHRRAGAARADDEDRGLGRRRHDNEFIVVILRNEAEKSPALGCLKTMFGGLRRNGHHLKLLGAFKAMPHACGNDDEFVLGEKEPFLFSIP